MFIVTAQVVKPVNPDDLPQMRGIDGLKGNSPLGVEPKGEGIQGQTGYKISGQNVETPQATEPVKAAEPASKTTTQSDTETSGTSGSGVAEVRKVNSALPMARAAKVEPYLEPIKPR